MASTVARRSPRHLFPDAPSKPPNPSPSLSTYPDSDTPACSSEYASSDSVSSGHALRSSHAYRRPTLIQTLLEPQTENRRTGSAEGGEEDVLGEMVCRPDGEPTIEDVRELPKYGSYVTEVRSLRWGREISFRAPWQVVPKQRLMQTTALAWETATTRVRRKVEFTHLLQQWTTSDAYATRAHGPWTHTRHQPLRALPAV